MTVAPAQPVSKGLGCCPTSASKIPGLTIRGKSRYFLQCGYPLALLADFQKCGKSVNLYRFTLLANFLSCHRKMIQRKNIFLLHYFIFSAKSCSNAMISSMHSSKAA